MLPAAHAKRGRSCRRQGFFHMEDIVNSFNSLYKAYRKTRCGKRDNPTAMRYRMEAIERTADLSDRLQRREYTFGPYYKALAFLSDEELIDFVEWLLWIVIDSTPDPGIPIGNQSSQLLALLYLDDFDHWLRDGLGLVYGRYMDDFYIISSDKLLLREILKKIEAYIKPLGLRLNGKTQIFPLKNGIDFFGFHTYLTSTGKVVRKVRAKSIDNMKRKIRKFRGLVDRGKMTLESVSQSYASWTGHISHGNTYHLRQNMDAYFYAYFPELKPTERRQDSCLKPSEALPTRQKSSSAASTARRSSGSRPTKTTPATLPTASPS